MLHISIDFNPGHDSQLKNAPVEWCKQKLNITTTPENWVYEGWGIYTSTIPIISQEQKEEIFANWENKYEGRARGLRIFKG